MNKEEKEAIVYFKNYIKEKKEVIKIRKNEEGWIVDSRYTQQLEEMVEAFETVLNLIEKQQAEIEDCKKCILRDEVHNYIEELEKKDKIIELMAEQLTTPIHSKEWVIDFYKREVEK